MGRCEINSRGFVRSAGVCAAVLIDTEFTTTFTLSAPLVFSSHGHYYVSHFIVRACLFLCISPGKFSFSFVYLLLKLRALLY